MFLKPKELDPVLFNELGSVLVLFQFIMLTYIFMLAWLGVTAFTSIPVFIYFNIWNICQNTTVLGGATLCLDPRQYGEDTCFFISAPSGAGATLESWPG